MSFTSSVPLIFIPLIDIKALAYNDHDIIDILALQSRSSFNKLALGQRGAATYCDPFDLAGKDASKSLKMGKNAVFNWALSLGQHQCCRCAFVL